MGWYQNTAYKLVTLGLATVLTIGLFGSAIACTGIRLTAEDGSVVYGRSMEWGAFDLNSRVAIIPRGHEFTGQTPEGLNGQTWTAKHGAVALDILEHDWFADGINEAGLTVGLFYHPGFAEYADYVPAGTKNTIGSIDLTGYLLTKFATVDEVIQGLAESARGWRRGSGRFLRRVPLDGHRTVRPLNRDRICRGRGPDL